MFQILVAKLNDWRDQLKKNGIWDSGDCAAYQKMFYAIEVIYGDRPREGD